MGSSNGLISGENPKNDGLKQPKSNGGGLVDANPNDGIVKPKPAPEPKPGEKILLNEQAKRGGSNG